MLEHVEIRNFQSLRNVVLDLGRFTVIVGASSAGKSAIVRAVKAVASNVSGTSVITRGATTAAITVRTADAVITLEHSRGAWRYRLATPDGVEEEYSKLNRAVPPAVTTALRIDPVPAGGCSLNVAGQFDRPWLLGESGATVARVLGELTNVDTLFQAVAEANRQRRGHSATLRTRLTDRDRLAGQVRQFRCLPARLAACDRAEAAAARATVLELRIARLTAAINAHDSAAEHAQQSTAPQVPSDTALCQLQSDIGRLEGLLNTVAAAHREVGQANRSIVGAEAEEHARHDDLHALLVAAGTCPTCRRPIER